MAWITSQLAEPLWRWNQQSRRSSIAERLTMAVNDTGAPLNHLMLSGFVQAPRKGRRLPLIPQISGIAPLYRHCVFL